MGRVVKGGVWKNTEDEILKAAVSKYGLNQWARISSLLVRKTPKQCKARWYEWLDPSIKKIEWSREEDEKLLHMAKLMPTQWRTIAPIVGRTATQCLERYQQLLDDADAQSSELALAGPGAEAAPSADQVLKLRPGEIDPDPESRPAKPDPVDMDEDEKEMLSEARARLANTEGKKAKRKARERALDEARRLSTLQKRRELRAAGLLAKGKDKKPGIDYNAEIPFEKQPLPGFYDTTEEAAKVYEEPMRRTLQQMDPGHRQSDEEAKRKRERALNKPARHEEALRRLREAEQVTKRRKLALPDAQVGERELEQIVKLGHASEAARALVESNDGAATEGLLTHYAPLEQGAAPTPTGHDSDALVREARELHSRTIAQTPLLGGENTPMPPPRAPDATPAPSATPLRASLGLRTDVPATPRDPKAVARAAQRELDAALASLPAPKNDFELVVDAPPEAPPVEAPTLAEDATVRDARDAELAAAERAREYAQRTQVVRRALPRPANVDEQDVLSLLQSLRLPSAPPAQALVDEELARLMAHDARVFPLPGSRHPGGLVPTLRPVADEHRAAAAALVEAEMADGAPHGALDEVLRVAEAWTPAGHAAMYDAVPPAERVRGAMARHEQLRVRLTEVAAQAAKSEKTLGKLLGGYEARSRMLATQIRAAATQHVDQLITHEALARLAASEPASGADRLERLQGEVARLQAVEVRAQDEYRDLSAVRAEAQEAYEELRTELEMREAEMALA
ncbi:Pre-mRNA-splicing factor cef1 [Malassezia caprae]|uniref:Pre-mRNA-splicing factor CEF1 n=1 Tax=Malassezia caprae TaxID=1381934 RepID=A0AAF0EE14_9BASI|nr:Pre-mRNA-splicing factor cef1 [Malassezia caprae]